MKRKLMALVMSAAVMLCMCGCDKKDFPQPFIAQIGSGIISYSYDIEIKETDPKIINKCFEKIQIGPAVLTVPMNVSDLPEEISLSPDKYNILNSHNGFKTVFADLHIDDNSIGCAEILCTDEEKLTDGVVVSITVYSMYANAVFGDVSLDMRLGEIDKAMGHSGDLSADCIYTSSDGKAIYVSHYYDTDGATYVCLSADPEFLFDIRGMI